MNMIELEGTFRAVESDGKVKHFRSRSPESGMCAPFIITHAVRKRVVEGAEVVLPEGLKNDSSLIVLGWKTKTSEKEVILSSQIAHDLQQIGSQLLNLNEEGKIQPPFTPVETAYIEQLVNTVSATEQPTGVLNATR